MVKYTNRFETLAIHGGGTPDPTAGAVVNQTHPTDAYAQAGLDEDKEHRYSQTTNPARTALENRLALLDGAKFALTFSSGLAATDVLLRLASPGQHVLVGNNIYGSTYFLFEKILRRYEIEFSYVDMSNIASVEDALRFETCLVWLESPMNPLLKLVDISAISELAHEHGAQLVIDNTCATPYLQRPLDLGADFVLYSNTKYLAGHSDVIGGAIIIGSDDDYHALKFLQNAIGAVPGALDCWLILRGLKTLSVRMERHCYNARLIAITLQEHPAISTVYYPGLPSNPSYRLAKRQMSSYGGMIAFILKGGEKAARQVINNTRIFTLAEALGGTESLIDHPASMTHTSANDSVLAVNPGLVCLSVGIEHVEDLISDLKTALESITT